jgi:predicted DNA-binding transcriptional regulator AlpA
MASKTVAPIPGRSAQRDWMSINDFCEELGVAMSTAYKWSAAGAASGRFPRYRRLPNGSIRIRRDWFEEWVDTPGPAS